MNSIYEFVIGSETDPMLIIFRIIIFFIVFEGVINLITGLMTMAQGGNR